MANPQETIAAILQMSVEMIGPQDYVDAVSLRSIIADCEDDGSPAVEALHVIATLEPVELEGWEYIEFARVQSILANLDLKALVRQAKEAIAEEEAAIDPGRMPIHATLVNAMQPYLKESVSHQEAYALAVSLLHAIRDEAIRLYHRPPPPEHAPPVGTDHTADPASAKTQDITPSRTRWPFNIRIPAKLVKLRRTS